MKAPTPFIRRAGASAADAPPAGTATCPPVATSSRAADHPASVRDVLALRQVQISQHGHTPAADAARPLDRHFLPLLRDMARGAFDYLHFNRLDLARRYLVKLAAMCLATIDRIDAETAGAWPAGLDRRRDHTHQGDF